MDLLLHLIAKHKIDINDIPIFELVEQYVEYVREMQQSDMEVASEFVEMAARLIYIKTVSLLPVHEEAEQLKEELRGELIKYRDCKAVAAMLSERTEGFDRFCRAPAQIKKDMRYRRIHEPEELLRFYISAVGRGKKLPAPSLDSFKTIVTQKIVSVNSRIAFVYRNLLKKSKIRFSQLFESSSSRSEMVATFLAVLELIKADKIKTDGDGEHTEIRFSVPRKRI